MFDLHKKSHPNDEIVGWLVNLANKIIFSGYYMVQTKSAFKSTLECINLQGLLLSSASLAWHDQEHITYVQD